MSRILRAAVILACIAAPRIAQAGEAAKLGAQAKTILQTHCAGCHGGGKAVKGGFGFVLDRDLLVSRLLVTPGQAAQSDLVQRIQSGEMPPKSSKTRPSPAEVKVLTRWIEGGAPAFDASKPVLALSRAEATDAILSDLKGMDPRRRRFTRYLTLNHFALAGRPAADRDTAREAAGKLLNSLSWHPRVSVPESVDAGGTILRIDLRAFKWNASLWDRLASAYPYRLQTAAESKAFANLAGTEVAAVRADWFVATASRPPFYHDLLQLPTTDKALERMLQVDVQVNLQEDTIQRSGFNDSGVSKNNRLLERHDAAYGILWRSYDFAGNAGRQNLFEHPIGPNTGAISFQPAGGEMIFNLPNGLQAYMLVDGKGRRIDKGPTEIVADPRRPDQRVENGISCMSCHVRGLLFKADQIRGHVEKNAAVFGKEIVEAIRATHPRKAKLQTQIEADSQRYLHALEKFGIRDPDQEPVNRVTLRFEGTLDGANAAAELGLKYDAFESFLRQNPDQARIFGSLLVKGGTAQRTVFQEQFPELARRVIAQEAVVAAKAKTQLEPAFAGHAAAVNAVTFSRSGRLAASGSDDRSIRIWEAPTGRLRGAPLLAPGAAEVYAVAFSPDERFLLGAGRDRVLRLWDVTQQKALRVFRGHTDSVRCVAISPDGKRAVSGGDDRSVRVWDIATGDEIAAFVGHTDAVTAVAWIGDGKSVLSGSRDGTARHWSIATRKPLARLEGHAGAVLSVAVARDGKTALTGGNDRTIRLWRLSDGQELHCFRGHTSAVVCVQFDADGATFLSGSSQHQAAEPTWRRWRLADRKEVSALAAAPEVRFGCVAFSADGRHVLAGGAGGFLKLWNFPSHSAP